MLPRKVMVTGSRGWTDDMLIHDVLFSWWMEKGEPDAVLISGGARGADQMAQDVAETLGWSVIVVRPEWDIYGKSAGFRRNTTMLDMGPEVLFAFWDGRSRGTNDTIEKAAERRIPVILTVDDGWVVSGKLADG